MKKAAKTKLVLNQQAIRQLDHATLTGVAGGLVYDTKWVVSAIADGCLVTYGCTQGHTGCEG
jgi:hypothetical protein